MALYHYSSTHAGAPALEYATVGSLLNILDACLVGTAGTAYGSTASMGWTLEYSGSGTRSYRQPTAGTSGFYLSVTDTNTGSYAAVNARAYETMTSVSAGTNPFPTVAQMANGVFYDKGISQTGNPTKAWDLYSNGKIFHLVTDSAGNLYNSQYLHTGKIFTFGDAYSYYPSDPYACIILGYTAAGGTSFFTVAGTASATTVASYIARNSNGTSVGMATTKMPIFPHTNVTSINNTVRNGSLFVSRIYLQDVPAAGRTFRGYIPGLWSVNTLSLPYVKYYADIEAESGKTFRIFSTYSSVPLAIETSDGW